MSGLPRGWVQTTIGEVCSYIQRGKSPKYTKASELPVINQKCVRWWGIDERYLKFVDSDQWSSWTEERFLVPEDVLWNSTGTGTIGRAALFKGLRSADRAVVDSHVTVLRPNGAVIGGFLHRFIQSPGVQNAIVDMQSGTTNQVELNRTEVIETALPLPPLAEQKRILAKLDALNAKSARARTELARIETLVSRYKQALLRKAFGGNSTTRRLGELVARIKAGKNLRCEERPPHPHEKGVVKVSAVTWGEFRADQSKTLPPDFKPDEDTRIKTGDFLFSRANTIDLVGAVVIVADVPDNLYLSDKILRLEFAEPIDNWLLWYLRSPMGREALMNISSGNQLSMRNIGQKSLLSLSIPYAPADLRHDIIRRIESAFSKIDRHAGEARGALKLVGQLDEAILGKAFRGGLVAQDENDEPATVLLDKIKRTRVDQPQKARLKPAAQPRKVRSMANTLFEALSQSKDWLTSKDLFERCGVRDGSSTEDVETIYRQLLELERQEKIEIEEVADPSTGIKLGDRVRLRR